MEEKRLTVDKPKKFEKLVKRLERTSRKHCS